MDHTTENPAAGARQRGVATCACRRRAHAKGKRHRRAKAISAPAGRGATGVGGRQRTASGLMNLWRCDLGAGRSFVVSTHILVNHELVRARGSARVRFDLPPLSHKRWNGSRSMPRGGAISVRRSGGRMAMNAGPHDVNAPSPMLLPRSNMPAGGRPGVSVPSRDQAAAVEARLQGRDHRLRADHAVGGSSIRAR